MPKKKTITKLDLLEISAVDKPAHEGATIDIRKRAQEYDVDKALSLGISAYWYEICCSYDVKWSVEKFERLITKELPLVALYISKMAEEYKDEDEEFEIPEDSALAAFLEKNFVSKLKQKDGIMSKEPENEVNEKLEALEAENKRLAKVAGLTASQKAHFDSLDENLEDDVRTKFLDMTSEQRDEVVEAATKAKAEAAEEKNPVVYKAMDGTEYRKEDDVRLVEMAKRLDNEAKESAAAKAREFDADVTKHAETDFAHLPGDLDTRKSLIAATLKIEDEEIRTKALDSLRAKSAGNSELSIAKGSSNAPVEANSDQEAANTELEKKAKKYAEEHNVDFYKAYRIVSEQNTELLAKAAGH